MKRVLVVYRQQKAVDPYAEALRQASLEPVLAEASDGLKLRGADGLLLTGGEDVNPERYGAARWAETEPPDDERDRVELNLIAEALERDVPLFGICRGLQVLNVALGGSLIQHLTTTERHCQRPPDRERVAHEITIEPSSLLARIAGREKWEVNSRHHQAIERLGEGLLVSARDDTDGTIEAVERPDRRFLLAVQWHPENQALKGPEQQKLFAGFREAIEGARRGNGA